MYIATLSTQVPLVYSYLVMSSVGLINNKLCMYVHV